MVALTRSAGRPRYRSDVSIVPPVRNEDALRAYRVEAFLYCLIDSGTKTARIIPIQIVE